MSSQCPVCGADTVDFMHQKTKITYHDCHRCGYIHKNPAFYPASAAEKAVYLQHNNSLAQADYVAYLRHFLDNALIPHLRADRRHGLDYGSGPNPVLATLLERDYGMKMRLYDPFFHPDSRYADDMYDFIVSTEVFEHLREPMAVFAGLAARLRPGGVMALMTLFHPDDEDAFRNWWYIRDITHIGFFLPRTFALMADTLGLAVIATDNRRYVTISKKQG